MVYFSQLQKGSILDARGNMVGKLVDFVFVDGRKKAEITHVVFKDEDHDRKKIPWSVVKDIALDKKTKALKMRLTDSVSKLDPFFVKPQDILVGGLIDKQVVDIDKVKVVRINDVLLEKDDSKFCIVGVAIGKRSFLRRIGLGYFTHGMKEDVISWRLIERLEKNLHSIHLTIQKEKIEDLHSEDIADLMGDLPTSERLILFNSLNKKKAAKTLLGAEEAVSQSIVQNLKIEKIKDLLEEITPNQSADILEMFPHHKAEQILHLMRKDKAVKIKKIMGYMADSAGAIMKIDPICVSVDETVKHTIEVIRNANLPASRTYRIYVIDHDQNLRGFVTMKSLLLSKAREKISAIMDKTVYSVQTTTPKKDIAQIMARYDLLVLPVVDMKDKLVGLVTADDVITQVIPRSWIQEKTLPHKIKPKNGEHTHEATKIKHSVKN